MACLSARLVVELREIELRHKPSAMLLASPKGTVPVLLLGNGEVIDESLDIMDWALRQNDPEQWLANSMLADSQSLIQWNDGEFKYFLDRYKYADRYPQYSCLDYRRQGERFLADLEGRLNRWRYLCGHCFSLADAAILPFIRQFAAVDSGWFDNAPYPALRRWLNEFLLSRCFHQAMKKYPSWRPSDPPVWLVQD